ncbi:MAG: GGDEF domain-containing protein [Acidimicrobiia bacterium]|nr:GGDEF domain-containing protein [Acidimicrobiia bacterium]MDJ0664264.1 GGDEF domain-containing protein [Acidimicrobiia bacterium]
MVLHRERLSQAPTYSEVPAWGVLARGICPPRWVVLVSAIVAAAGLLVVDTIIGSDAHVLLGAYVIVAAVTWAGRTYEASFIGVAIMGLWAIRQLEAANATQGSRVILAAMSGSILLGIGIALTKTFRRLVLELDEATRRDSLTGLLNTGALQRTGEHARVGAATSRLPMTIAFLDLDDFKGVNDVHGHIVGDNVLSAFGEVISKSIRSTDIAGRVGGDEFTLILPNTGPHEATAVLNRIRHSLAARTDIPVVTATAGFVTFRVPPGSVEEMIHTADDLMYRGKRRPAGHWRMVGRVVDTEGRVEQMASPRLIDITETPEDHSPEAADGAISLISS